MKLSDILLLLLQAPLVVFGFSSNKLVNRPFTYNRVSVPNIASYIVPPSSFSLYKQNTRLNTFPVIQSSNNNDNPVDKSNDNDNNPIVSKLKVIIPVIAVVGLLFYANANGGFESIKSFDVIAFLERTVEKVASLGPLGYVYFSLIYIAAEVLAIPVMPLTASSGYLFGLFPGALVVLGSATIAACISFYIGRTFLRDWARSKTAGNSLWKMIDTAVGREGFKIILLLRLSPLLPFALSNYLYGITSVDFGSYFLATLLGFAPGSIGIVYAGSAGKALLDTHGGSLPWYFYAGVGGLIFLAGKTIAKIASDTVKQVQLEEEQEQKLKTLGEMKSPGNANKDGSGTN